MATPRYIVKKVGDRYVTEPVQERDGAKELACSIGGVGLMVCGNSRGGLLGKVAFLAGVGLLYRAFTGHAPMAWMFCSTYRRDRSGTPEQSPSHQHDFEHRSSQVPADAVDEGSMESFPASDPPAHMSRSAAL